MICSLNRIFFNIGNIIVIKHRQLLDNNPTLDEINKIKQMTIFDKNKLDYNVIFKKFYQIIFYYP